MTRSGSPRRQAAGSSDGLSSSNEAKLESQHAGVAQLVEHQLPKLRVVGSSPIARFDESLPARERSAEPCRPGRAQGRCVRRLVRVLRAHRGHLEARVAEGGADIRIRVEVLPVLLGEGVTVTGPRELDPGVAGAGSGSTTLLITKSFPAD